MNMEKTVEAAKGRWKGILVRFGVDSDLLDGKHHACPICRDGKDRFRFEDDEGSGSYYCSQCGPGYGMGFLMKLRGWNFGQAAKEVDAVLGVVPAAAPGRPQRTPQDKRTAIRRLLESASYVTPDTPAGLYLMGRCGDISGQTNDLRAHAALRHSQEDPKTYPALLAIMRFADGSGASVHRTYLTPEGRKASLDPVRKIMPCDTTEGSAVRLGPVQERLGIAEGIETALCASGLFQVPCWAGISANGILSWVPPEGVRSVVIFGDNDANFIGQAAAFEKAKRLRQAGLDVEIRIPDVPGQDWADVWALQQHQEVA